jgi:hypothetical protein
MINPVDWNRPLKPGREEHLIYRVRDAIDYPLDLVRAAFCRLHGGQRPRLLQGGHRPGELGPHRRVGRRLSRRRHLVYVDPTHAHATRTFAATPGTYRVSTWWPGGTFRQHRAQYTVSSCGTPAGTPVVIDQQNGSQIYLGNFTDAGVIWYDIFPAVAIAGTYLTVTVTGLTPNTGGADQNRLMSPCVRIERLPGAGLDSSDRT